MYYNLHSQSGTLSYKGVGDLTTSLQCLYWFPPKASPSIPGTSSILPAMPTTDIDRSFHGAAPERIDPERWGLANVGATVTSDVYAFGVLTWEVRVQFITSVNH